MWVSPCPGRAAVSRAVSFHEPLGAAAGEALLFRHQTEVVLESVLPGLSLEVWTVRFYSLLVVQHMITGVFIFFFSGLIYRVLHSIENTRVLLVLAVCVFCSV